MSPSQLYAKFGPLPNQLLPPQTWTFGTFPPAHVWSLPLAASGPPVTPRFYDLISDLNRSLKLHHTGRDKGGSVPGAEQILGPAPDNFLWLQRRAFDWTRRRCTGKRRTPVRPSTGVKMSRVSLGSLGRWEVGGRHLLFARAWWGPSLRGKLPVKYHPARGHRTRRISSYQEWYRFRKCLHFRSAHLDPFQKIT